MSNYVIGDVQGCNRTLQRLLKKIDFDPLTDHLWLVGDLVNRGPDSLGVLEFVYQHRKSISIVLGNHDLHLIAVASGVSDLKKDDTLQDILKSPKCDELTRWLRKQPLFRVDGSHAFVHAGLLPNWDIKTAQKLSDEIHFILIGHRYKDLLQNMRGRSPSLWSDKLKKWDRYRFIINAFTRMRMCEMSGEMNFDEKAPPESAPKHLLPWFELSSNNRREYTLFFGHWSALGFYRGDGIIGLDSGCVWGRSLTAYCIETQEITQLPSCD